MDNHELIWEFQRKIVEIYNQQHLFPLRGENDSYQINGKEILMWFHDVTNPNSVKYNLHTTYFDLQNDLFICSDEMIYFTAHLFLYRPYMNNPLEAGHEFYGREIFPNHENIEAKRYNMFSDIVSQKTYNFWDRIGDLIASFFPDKIKSHQVFFSSAIDCIPQEFHSSDNFKWLNEFKENEYVKLNSIRKKIVHYTTTATDYKQRHLKVKTREEMEILQAEREGLPEYYKNQIKLTLEGFEKTLHLLEDFNRVLFPK
jgi:hypothetical protein